MFGQLLAGHISLSTKFSTFSSPGTTICATVWAIPGPTVCPSAGTDVPSNASGEATAPSSGGDDAEWIRG